MPTDEAESSAAAEYAALVRRVCEVRAWSGLNQREFSSKLGVSRSYLSEVEGGKGKPNVEIIVGIATNFPLIDPVWLLTGDGEMEISPLSLLAEGEALGSIDVPALTECLHLVDDYCPTGDEARAKFIAILYKEYVREALLSKKVGFSDEMSKKNAIKNIEILARNMPQDWLASLGGAGFSGDWVRDAFMRRQASKNNDSQDEK